MPVPTINFKAISCGAWWSLAMSDVGNRDDDYFEFSKGSMPSGIADLWDKSRSMGQHPKTEKTQSPLSD